MLRIFSCACSPSVCPFGEVFTQVFCPVFDWVVCFLVIELYKLFIYFGNEALVGYIICKYFLLVCRLFFILFKVSFAVPKLTNLTRSCLFTFIFISVAFGDWPKKTLVQFMSENVLPEITSSSFMVACLMLSH